MRPVTTLKPPSGGWRGHDPVVVVQVAQMLMAARLIDGDTATGRKLLRAWRAIDTDHPDATAYSRMVAELVPSEHDFQAAFRSLTDGEE
jgi:hypothetical protein